MGQFYYADTGVFPTDDDFWCRLLYWPSEQKGISAIKKQSMTTASAQIIRALPLGLGVDRKYRW
jgi:hypothetical protein